MSALENSLTVAQKVQHKFNKKFNKCTAIPLLGIYAGELETHPLKKNLHTNVHSIIIHESPKVEATKISIN